MALHPQVKRVLDMMASRETPPLEEMTLQQARQSFLDMCRQMNLSEEVAHVEDRHIPGYQDDIAIRIYKPEGSGIHPALVYFHGGGWVLGNLDSHDALCRSLVNRADCVVVSVDYSLAPEHKFPVAVEDAYLATRWISEHADELGIDPNRIAVGGDSAGGNLATVVCHLSRVRQSPSVCYQLLIYPSTGFYLTESFEKYSEGYFLTQSTMTWFRECYFNHEDELKSPLAAPVLLSESELAEMPPALIMTAEYDPLRDGGKDYADKLNKAGVDVRYVCYPGMIHGFMSMCAAIDDGKKAIDDAARELKTRFQQPASS
ncbi:MAG: alpha/beta hydrolase [Bacillaceae bacterium]|nr:alpha/beta hydrolase [Bacillaceae bacterium]